MISFQIKSVPLFNTKKTIHILNDTNQTVAEIVKTTNSEHERGTTFTFKQNEKEACLGIKKGRILFATYNFEANGEPFTFKDNPMQSILSFSVSGKLQHEKITFRENWNEEIEVNLDKQHVATIQPHSLSLDATVLIDETHANHFTLFSLTCFMYLMYIIYKDETDTIETIIDELI